LPGQRQDAGDLGHAARSQRERQFRDARRPRLLSARRDHPDRARRLQAPRPRFPLEEDMMTSTASRHDAADRPRLALSDISCAFGPVLAVERLSLDIEPGEFVSLLGPSGCGKTTTLRMIAGFITPTAGTIAMDGDVISSPGSSLPPERRQMSMIFQSYAIWPNMTVAENVAFGLQLRR